MDKLEFKFDISKFDANKLITNAQKELKTMGNSIDDFTRISETAKEKYKAIFDEITKQKHKFEYELDNMLLKRDDYITANNKLKIAYKEVLELANRNINSISDAMHDKLLVYIKEEYKIEDKLAKLLLEEVTKDNYIESYGFAAADEKIRSLLEFYRKADKLVN